MRPYKTEPLAVLISQCQRITKAGDSFVEPPFACGQTNAKPFHAFKHYPHSAPRLLQQNPETATGRKEKPLPGSGQAVAKFFLFRWAISHELLPSALFALRQFCPAPLET